MARFSEGSIDILVATTVIEVGVDVPEASVVVVERAERFGLAQLHQLRGRVGRGGARFVLPAALRKPVDRDRRARLNVMRETDDGFLIAEEDLRLRGAGELPWHPTIRPCPIFASRTCRPMPTCLRSRATTRG